MTAPSVGTRGHHGWIALVCMAMQFPASLPWSLAALCTWVGALAWFEPETLHRLWVPRFWGVSLLVAVASGIVLGQQDMEVLGVSLSSSGLTAGVLMVVRGAFIFALSTWVSRRLGGPTVQNALHRAGLGELGQALSAALHLLPELAARLASRWSHHHFTDWRSRLRAAHSLAVDIVEHTARLAEEMVTTTASRTDVRPTVVAVVGPPGSGKTTQIMDIIRRLREAGVGVGGIIQPAFPSKGVRSGYSVLDITTGEESSLCHRDSPDQSFQFTPGCWAWARERIVEACHGAQVIIVDELGRLEARGEGHMPALIAGMENSAVSVLLLSVREDCAAAIAHQVGAFTTVLRAQASNDQAAATAHHIIQRARPATSTGDSSC